MILGSVMMLFKVPYEMRNITLQKKIFNYEKY